MCYSNILVQKSCQFEIGKLVDRFFTGCVAPQYQTRIKVCFRPRPLNLLKRLHDV